MPEPTAGTCPSASFFLLLAGNTNKRVTDFGPSIKQDESFENVDMVVPSRLEVTTANPSFAGQEKPLLLLLPPVKNSAKLRANSDERLASC